MLRSKTKSCDIRSLCLAFVGFMEQLVYFYFLLYMEDGSAPPGNYHKGPNCSLKSCHCSSGVPGQQTWNFTSASLLFNWQACFIIWLTTHHSLCLHTWVWTIGHSSSCSAQVFCNCQCAQYCQRKHKEERLLCCQYDIFGCLSADIAEALQSICYMQHTLNAIYNFNHCINVEHEHQLKCFYLGWKAKSPSSGRLELSIVLLWFGLFLL